MIEATNELYKKCERTVEQACRKAWLKNPIIQLDDYRSYAHEVFMDATLSFDESKGTKFNSWLTTQLMRLTPYPRNFKMTTSSKQDSSSLVLSLDETSEMLEGRPCTLNDLKFPVNDVYSKTLSEPTFVPDWCERIESLKPYLGELSEDAKVMVDDIIGGETEKKDENGVPIAPRGKNRYARLTPRQLYTRLYCRRGWTIERVKNARREVETVLIKISPEYKMLRSNDEEISNMVQEELF